MSIKTLIAGSRTIKDMDDLIVAIKVSGLSISSIVSGRARGVDTLGEELSQIFKIPLYVYPAMWKTWGNKAGFIRNEEMAKVCEQGLIVWNGKSSGTYSMIRLLQKYKVTHHIHITDEVKIMTQEVPGFVAQVRKIVPKEGIQTDKPSRIKSKIRKALNRAGYQTETLRGIGQKVGDYVILYSEKDNLLFATFDKYSPDLVVPKSNKGRSKRSKKSPLLLGPHHSCQGVSPGQFAELVVALLPQDWKFQKASVYRWITIDTFFLLNNQYTEQTAADFIIGMANKLLSKVETINYTTMQINGRYLIGIGPTQ